LLEDRAASGGTYRQYGDEPISSLRHSRQDWFTPILHVVNIGTDIAGQLRSRCRNPWGIDGPTGILEIRSARPTGRSSPAQRERRIIRMRWDAFKQFFPTVVAA